MTGKYSRHYPKLLSLGIPIMIGQLGTIIMGFADTIMIGRYGTDELAAAGFVNNIIGMVLIAGIGFSYGLTPVVGALFGQGELQLIGGKLKNSLTANALMATLMMTLMAALYLCMDLVGLPQNLVPLMRPYLLVLTISLLPQMMFNAFKQFFDGIQDTRLPMWVLLSGNIMNVIGNWFLIYGIGPCPEMGLLGAGVATLFSRVFMWALMVFIFRRAKRYSDYRGHYDQSSVRRSHLLELTRLGLPVMLQMGMESASFSLSAFYVGWLGGIALAAHQIVITISQLCFMLFYGMAAAVAIAVSYFRGKGRIQESRNVAFAGLHLTWVMGSLLAVPIFLFRHQVGIWFTSDAEVITMVGAVIVPLCIYQYSDAMQCIFANALRGMADVKPMVWIAFIAYFLVSLPLGYLFSFPCQWGLLGVWWAFPFGLTTAGVLYMLRFLHSSRG
ncbi:MAG: MATE family efflux transporter [Bacteroidaceae bacterium]